MFNGIFTGRVQNALRFSAGMNGRKIDLCGRWAARYPAKNPGPGPRALAPWALGLGFFTIVREAALADLCGLDADRRGKTPASAEGYGKAKQKLEN